ncbi:MAG TPA: hypothetical protein VEH52_00870 [Gaiellaceae bacterium]|nr:hypothetical protein [Gaiellaceae bacterium]
MAMVVAWIVFPLVLAMLALGLGLLVERLASTPLPAPLLLPVGIATIVAISSITVSVSWGARWTTPLVAALGAAGLVLGRWRRLEGWAFGAGALVFLCFGAPVIASGTPTFAGYIELDDTATFLALADRAMEHGRSLAGLAPSSYEATLAGYLAHGYPLGSVLPLGIGHELVRLDSAWLYQPWLSLNAGLLALCLYQLAAPVIGRRPLRAAVAFVAAQPALLYGYALWGGVKELAAVTLIAAAAALAAELEAPVRAGSLVPLGIVCAALLETFSLAGLVWLVPLVPVLVPVVRHAPRKIAVGVATAVVLLVPALASAGSFYSGSNRLVLTSTSQLGNLLHPLHFIQIVGIWPSGDFRVDPHHRLATGLLILLAVAAALAGLAFSLGRKALGVPLAVASALTGAIVSVAFGSPWVGGKALAIGSPFVLLAAGVGCVGLASSALLRHRLARLASLGAAVLVAVLLVCGVAWSNALAYHDVSLAPYSQLRELQHIGARFAGDGPTLMTEYQPYGDRHFLRRLDPEGVSELRRRPIVLRDGRTAAKGQYVDIDQIRLADLLVYRTLVLRNSPTVSRPPAPYVLVWQGRWYQVWQRQPTPAITAHLPLGSALQPGAIPSCVRVRRIAVRAPLIAYPRPVNLVWSLDLARLPKGWTPLTGGALMPNRSATLSLDVRVPRSDRYTIWVGGSIRGRLTVSVDGSRIGSATRQLQNAGQWLGLGTVDLPAGAHRLTLAVSLPKLGPGTGGGGATLGPLLLRPRAKDRLLQHDAPASLCRMNLDWIETVPPVG